jgi:uncharacterized alkaline shock family protein YloU
VIDLEHSELGRIAVDEEALTRLVRDAAASVAGVRSVRSRSTHVTLDDPRAATVVVSLSCAAGAVLPDVARRVQADVGAAIANALDARPLRVDVTVEEVAD